VRLSASDDEALRLQGAFHGPTEDEGLHLIEHLKLTIGFVAFLLRRFISLSTAAGFHLAVALLFLWLLFSPASGDRESSFHIGLAGWSMGERGVIEKEDPAPAPVVEEKETPKEEVPPKEPEEKKEPEPEETPVPPLPPTAEPEPAIVTAEEPRDESPPKIPSIGTGASASAPPAPQPRSEELIEKDPLEAVRAKRAGDLRQLRSGEEASIVVVRGGYDQVERVLSRLGIPHRIVSFEMLETYDLSAAAVLLVNCDARYAAGQMEQHGTAESLRKQRADTVRAIEALDRKIRAAERRKDERRVREHEEEQQVLERYLRFFDEALQKAEHAREIVERIGTFVKEGGYLFTSDWGLTLLEEATPGNVERGGYIGPRSVTLETGEGAADHSLLREVFPSSSGKRELKWEIDGSSYLVRARGPRVETLVVGTQIRRDRAVAVSYPFEQGRVLHVLSHFYRQESKRGEYALQNMLLNFLVERLVR